MIFNNSKKAVRLLFSFFALMGVIAIFMAFPCSLMADTPEAINKDKKIIADNYSENAIILSEVNEDGADKNFLPILITSVVVVGILIFAMWQTFKSKRMY